MHPLHRLAQTHRRARMRLRQRQRRTQRKTNQHLVTQNKRRPLVVLSCLFIAPLMQAPQNTLLTAQRRARRRVLGGPREITAKSQPQRPPSTSRVALRVPWHLDICLGRRRFAPLKHVGDRTVSRMPLKVQTQAVVHIQERVRITAGIEQHLAGQRPNAPVGRLEALVRLKARIAQQQVRKAQTSKLQHTRSLERVKQVGDKQTQVTLQP